MVTEKSNLQGEKERQVFWDLKIPTPRIHFQRNHITQGKDMRWFRTMESSTKTNRVQGHREQRGRGQKREGNFVQTGFCSEWVATMVGFEQRKNTT